MQKEIELQCELKESAFVVVVVKTERNVRKHIRLIYELLWIGVGPPVSCSKLLILIKRQLSNAMLIRGCNNAKKNNYIAFIVQIMIYNEFKSWLTSL